MLYFKNSHLALGSVSSGGGSIKIRFISLDGLAQHKIFLDKSELLNFQYEGPFKTGFW